MNLQLALDRLSREECLTIVDQARAHIDWIEVGTGVIKQYGMAIIQDLKAAFPEKTLVADMKTCDAGRYEAMQVFDAGADVTTVMAFAATRTITDMLEVARSRQRRVMIDLLNVAERRRVEELHAAGADFFSLHLGKDQQGEGHRLSDAFELVRGLPAVNTAVAGGIDSRTLATLLSFQPNVVIVGSSITHAADPREAARALKELMIQHETAH